VTPRFVRFVTLTAMATLVATSLFAADPVTETVHLVVTGGPNAGTYNATTERGGCSFGLAGPGSWGNQLSDPKDKDPKHFNSLQLIVPNAKKAAGGTHEFLLKIGFGPLMHRGAEYTVETRAGEAKKSGSGTLTVLDKGTTGVVTFDAKTADGVRLAGTIDCKSVMRGN
jgi:hypothetical protein